MFALVLSLLRFFIKFKNYLGPLVRLTTLHSFHPQLLLSISSTNIMSWIDFPLNCIQSVPFSIFYIASSMKISNRSVTNDALHYTYTYSISFITICWDLRRSSDLESCSSWSISILCGEKIVHLNKWDAEGENL